jgi:hypothetical protein
MTVDQKWIDEFREEMQKEYERRLAKCKTIEGAMALQEKYAEASNALLDLLIQS